MDNIMPAADLPEDRNARIEAGLPLVLEIAREYEGRDLSLDDLVQIGCVGLIKAIDRNIDAGPLIRGEIESFIRK